MKPVQFAFHRDCFLAIINLWISKIYPCLDILPYSFYFTQMCLLGLISFIRSHMHGHYVMLLQWHSDEMLTSNISSQVIFLLNVF